MAKFIVTGMGDPMQALFDAGVIQHDPSYVRRVVIDLQAGSPGMVYVELYADDETLAAGLRSSGIEVTAA